MGTYTLLRLDGAVALSNRVPLITILEMHCGNVRAYIERRGIRATLSPYISILTSTFSHEVSVLMDLYSTVGLKQCKDEGCLICFKQEYNSAPACLKAQFTQWIIYALSWHPKPTWLSSVYIYTKLYSFFSSSFI